MIEDIVFEKALTTEKFLREIELLVSKHKLEYMDAIVHFCEINSVEIETVASLVRGNARIKAKLQSECEALNYLPKRAKLPF